MGNEGSAQHLPADPVADGVDYRRGDGGGDGKPVLQKQGKTQLAALGNAGIGVDMTKTKGQTGTAEQGCDH